MSAVLILLVIAMILCFFAAVPMPWSTPVQLGWLGMFFYLLALVVGGRS